MKQHLEKMVGQVVVLRTEKGYQVGILESVTAEGITLKELPKAEQNGVDAQHVFWGGGFYPWGGFGLGYGFGRGWGGWGGGWGRGFGWGGFGYRPFGGFWW